MTTVTDVKDRPILFSGPMVRAILEGRKTQTRRVMKPQPPRGFGWPECSESGTWAFLREREKREWFDVRCPYGLVGELLWVRESWAMRGLPATLGIRGAKYAAPKAFLYRADGGKPPAGIQWVASIHMPRAASRITLEVVGVRVERLWKITEADVLAEGIEPQHLERNREWFLRNDVAGVTFSEPWDAINGKRPGCAWRDNPWVWVVEFRRMEASR